MILRIVALLLMCLGFTMSKSQDFYFVQISDTHFGYDDHDKISMELAKSINDLPFDIQAVIHTGDIFQDNLHEETAISTFYQFKSLIKPPLYVLPGNHDILPDKYDEHVNIFQSKIGSLNKIFTIDSVSFLMYYSIPVADSLPDIEVQKQWISHSLKLLQDKQVIICHHQPSVLDFYQNKDHLSWPEKEMEWWSSLVNKYNAEAIITGHFHRDELHWLDDVPVYVGGPVAGFWGRQASYRVYHYENKKLSYKTIYLNE
jgi:predicted phosphodiesterase